MTEPVSRRPSSRRGAALGAALAALALAALCAIAPALAAAAQEVHTPLSTQSPQLSGTPAVGQTLSCSPGGWTYSPASYSYSWLRDGRPMPGQSASTYVLQSADEGHAISCAVSATAASGEYSIDALTSRAYRVRFSAGSEGGGNHLPQTYNGKSLTEGFDPVTLSAPGTVSGIDAALSAGGQISGKVTSIAGGAPISGSEVCAYDTSLSYGECAHTDAAGEYVIPALLAGSYEVTAEAPRGSDYLRSSHAGAVAVAVGQTTAGVGVTLRAGGQISGTVTSAKSGQPIADAQVCARPTKQGQGPCVYTNAAGEYRMVGLEENGYDIEFDTEGMEANGGGWTYAPQNYVPQIYNEKPIGSTPDEVSVSLSKPTTEGVDAKLQVGATVSGKVADSEGVGVPRIEACVDGAGGRGYCAFGGASGEYEIVGVPAGEYEVVFSREGTVAKSSRFTLSAEGSAEGIDGEASLLGSISGVVTSASSGAPLAGIKVCAEDTSSHMEECAFTGPHGEYEIVSLAEGEYEVEFNAEDEADNGYAIQYWNGVESPAAAQTTHVALGQTTAGIDAALTGGGKITGRVTDAATGAGIAGAHVCAESTSGNYFYECATTAAGGTSTAAVSNALSVPAAQPAPTSSPNSAFKVLQRSIDRKTGAVHLSVQTENQGRLSWEISFKCTDGRHHGACRAKSARFANGSKSLNAGVVDVTIHPDARARAALSQGHAIQISGVLTFQSSLGGKARSLPFKLTLAPREKGARHKGRGHGHRSKGKAHKHRHSSKRHHRKRKKK